MKSQDACENCHDGSCPGQWAIFREDTAGWRVRQFFASCLTENFHAKTFFICRGSGLSRRSVQLEHCICLRHGGKTPKEKIAAAATAEYGYGRESETDRIPVVISRTPQRNSRTGSGIRGEFSDHKDQDRVKDKISSRFLRGSPRIRIACIQRKHLTDGRITEFRIAGRKRDVGDGRKGSPFW